MSWILWAVVLLAQNASFTLVSRARNSKSLVYHAWAAVLSNGVWFTSLLIATDKIVEVKTSGNWLYGTAVLAYYTTFTVAGSVAAHYVLMHHVEKKEEVCTGTDSENESKRSSERFQSTSTLSTPSVVKYGSSFRGVRR